MKDKCKGCMYDGGCITQDNLSGKLPYRRGCEEYTKKEVTK